MTEMMFLPLYSICSAGSITGQTGWASWNFSGNKSAQFHIGWQLNNLELGGHKELDFTFKNLNDPYFISIVDEIGVCERAW